MEERKVLNGDSIGEKFSIPCIRCDNSTKHEVVASVDITDVVLWADITEWTSYQIVQCRGCETYSFRKTKTSTEDIAMDTLGKEFQVVDVEIYPPRMVGRRKLRNFRYLPPKVRKVYEETHQALSSELPLLAGVGIRSLVEAVCQEEDTEGKDLKDKIDDLVRQGFLTPSGAEILQKLRLIGNETVHEMKSHDIRVLGTAFDVVEHLLLGVYILPKESEKIQ